MLLHFFFPFVFWEESRGFPELLRWGLKPGKERLACRAPWKSCLRAL